MTAIRNPAGVFGQTATSGGQIVKWMKNNSGAALATGDVVITDATGTLATTTTSASNKLAIGVVGWRSYSNQGDSKDSYAAGDNIPVIIYGPARVNIAANTVAAGGNLASSAAAKVAATPANGADAAAVQALIGSFIGVALEADGAKDSANTIRAFITKA